MEIHLIEKYNAKHGFTYVMPANRDAEVAFKISGNFDGEHYCGIELQDFQEMLEGLTEWGFEVYIRNEGESLSQAKCLNPQAKLLK